jgi:hypothetical protein
MADRGGVEERRRQWPQELVVRPSLLLLDEPTSGELDATTALALLTLRLGEYGTFSSTGGLSASTCSITFVAVKGHQYNSPPSKARAYLNRADVITTTTETGIGLKPWMLSLR